MSTFMSVYFKIHFDNVYCTIKMNIKCTWMGKMEANVRHHYQAYV